MKNDKSAWPDHFDLQDDSLHGPKIKRFIEDQLNALQRLDEERVIWARENLPDDYHVTYHFYDHSHRVADDIEKMAKFLGLPHPVPGNLFWAMLAHDIGKTLMPTPLWDTLEKPEDEIKARRREHTRLGVQLVEKHLKMDHPFIDLLKDIIAHHHEHMDGSGTFGLTGKELSAPVRLACIIEGFDGYSIPRYHYGTRDTSPPAVLKRMREEKGAPCYDMEIFESFAQMKMNAYKQRQKEG